MTKSRGDMTKLEVTLCIKNSIRELRENHNLTQQDLADSIAVTRGTIIALEKGSYNPSLELAFRLALFFKVKIEDIFLSEEKNCE